jgi:hypothetical protein
VVVVLEVRAGLTNGLVKECKLVDAVFVIMVDVWEAAGGDCGSAVDSGFAGACLWLVCVGIVEQVSVPVPEAVLLTGMRDGVVGSLEVNVLGILEWVRSDTNAAVLGDAGSAVCDAAMRLWDMLLASEP